MTASLQRTRRRASRRTGERGRTSGLHLFATPIGTCGLGWTVRGVDRIELPAPDEASLHAALLRRTADRDGEREFRSPPPAVRAVMRRLGRHLKGRSDDFTDVALDLGATSPFARRVYRALRRVPPGKTTTYAALARKAGQPGAARAVGRAVGANPLPLLVPCHRVIRADGKLGGFTAAGGARLKARILYAEGVILDPEQARAINHLRRDRVLRRLIDRLGPLPFAAQQPGDPYKELVSAIVYQQLGLKAAATIAGRLKALTPGPGFPTPHEMRALSVARLRRAGVSAQKAGYLKDLAARVAGGQLDFRRLPRMDDEAVIAELTQVRGIGRWSAEMFLMFQLRRPDVLPVGDLGFRYGVKEAFGMEALPEAAEITALGERWRPHRSLATAYFWAGREGAW